MSAAPRAAVVGEADPGPSAARIVAATLAAWRRSRAARAAVLAPALLLGAAAVLLLADLLSPLPADARLVLRWLPGLLALAAIGWGAHAVLRPPPVRRLALLAEERVPALQNRLVTALEVGDADGTVARAFRADAARRLAEADLRGVHPARLRRPALALAASAVFLALFILLTGGARAAWERWASPRDAYRGAWEEVRGRVVPGRTETAVPGFDELRWRVTPPAYAGLAPTEGRGEEGIAALPGSRVRIRSRFPARWTAVRASLVGGATLPVRRGGGEWWVEWTVGAADRGVSLEAVVPAGVADRRVVPVAVLADHPPDVVLSEPAADLVLPASAGRLLVRASATDDHGVGGLRLAWTKTTGSGESFEFTEGEWPWDRVERRGRRVVAERTVDLGALALKAGEMVHVRAVARDRNDVTGPGESASATRVVRIAREDELDQVTDVLALPPLMPDNPVMSQRMLVLLTERLVRRAASLSRDALLAEAGEIGAQQRRLRERVGEEVFARQTGGMEEGTGFEGAVAEHGHAGEGEEGHAAAEKPTPEETLERASEATGRGTRDEVEHRHDEAPVLNVDRTLLGIYNAMWAAERELGQGRPREALPHEMEALRLIQRRRGAERVFARGRVSVDALDVAAARGEGKTDEAAPSARRAGAASPSTLALAAEVDRASAALSRGGREASLALSALAARALADPAAPPDAATLLARAAAEAASGRTERARGFLARARSLLVRTRGEGGAPLPASADPAAAEYFRRLGRRGGP